MQVYYGSDFKLDNIASQKKLLSCILANSEELSKSESNQIGRYTEIDNYEDIKYQYGFMVFLSQYSDCNFKSPRK